MQSVAHPVAEVFLRGAEVDVRVVDGARVGLEQLTHLLVGVVYLLLGAALIATSFGWNPMGSSTPAPSRDAPKGSVIIAPGSAK